MERCNTDNNNVVRKRNRLRAIQVLGLAAAASLLGACATTTVSMDSSELATVQQARACWS